MTKKIKISELSALPESTPVDGYGTVGADGSNNTVRVPLGRFAEKAALDGKVDKEPGKGLSSNDFNDMLKAKLNGVDTGANRTIVDNELSYASTNPVQNKAVTYYLQSGKYNHIWPLIWNLFDTLGFASLNTIYDQMDSNGNYVHNAEADFPKVDTTVGTKRGREFGKANCGFDIPVPIGDFRGRMKNYTISFEMYVYDDAYINSRTDFPSITSVPTMCVIDNFNNQATTSKYHGFGFRKQNDGWGICYEQTRFHKIIDDSSIPRNTFITVTMQIRYGDTDSILTTTIKNNTNTLASDTFTLNASWSSGNNIGRFLLGKGYLNEENCTFRGRLRNLSIIIDDIQ